MFELIESLVRIDLLIGDIFILLKIVISSKETQLFFKPVPLILPVLEKNGDRGTEGDQSEDEQEEGQIAP